MIIGGRFSLESIVVPMDIGPILSNNMGIQHSRSNRNMPYQRILRLGIGKEKGMCQP